MTSRWQPASTGELAWLSDDHAIADVLVRRATVHRLVEARNLARRSHATRSAASKSNDPASSWPTPSLSTLRSSTTGNDGTHHSGCSARSSTSSATPTTSPAIKPADRAKPGAHESQSPIPVRLRRVLWKTHSLTRRAHLTEDPASHHPARDNVPGHHTSRLSGVSGRRADPRQMPATERA
jgi:hypothetical protein